MMEKGAKMTEEAKVKGVRKGAEAAKTAGKEIKEKAEKLKKKKQ